MIQSNVHSKPIKCDNVDGSCMGIDVYSEDLTGDYNPIERLAHTCRDNYENGHETDASTQICDDNISCDYVVGMVNGECNVRYQNKAICWNTMN